MVDELYNTLGCHLQLAGEDKDWYECIFFGLFFYLEKNDDSEEDAYDEWDLLDYAISFYINSSNNAFLNIIYDVFDAMIWVLYIRLGVTGMRTVDYGGLVSHFMEIDNPETGKPALYDKVEKKFVKFPERFGAWADR